jgi:hypothetical protein
MPRMAVWNDILELHRRIDNLGEIQIMNWEVVEKELAELRTDRDLILKMVADLKAIVEGGAEDAAKLLAVAAAIDEVGKSFEAVLAPKDDGGSTGEVLD